MATAMEINVNPDDIIKFKKMCPLVEKNKNCHIGKYCPYHDETNDICNTQKKIVSIIISNESDKTEIDLIEDLPIKKIYGDEATMVNFINSSWYLETRPEKINQMKSNMLKKLTKQAIYDVLKKGEKKKKIYYKMKNKPMYTVKLDIVDVNVVEHYIVEKKYPIISYDEPFIFKFSDVTEHDGNFTFKAVIKFMYEHYKYFLFEYWKTKYSAHINLIDLTKNVNSSYEFRFQPINNDNNNMVTNEIYNCHTINEFKNIKNFLPQYTDKRDEYFFHIRKKKVKYSKQDIIKNAGCILCFDSHKLSDCKYQFLLDKNEKKFDTLSELEQKQMINKYVQYKSTYKLQNQNTFEFNDIQEIKQRPMIFPTNIHDETNEIDQRIFKIHDKKLIEESRKEKLNVALDKVKETEKKSKEPEAKRRKLDDKNVKLS